LFVGGTMLYFSALSSGIAELPDGDLGVRAEIDRTAGAVGWVAMHRELARVDPDAAQHIHHNDAQRIQRALEVYRLTGQPISRLQRLRESVLAQVEVLEVAVAPAARSELHARIEARFAAMMAAGFVEEVRGLRQRNDLSAEQPAMRAVGYRQIWRYLDGRVELDEAVRQSIVATRQLAKRQFTWLRARRQAEWVDSARLDAVSPVIDLLATRGIKECL